jgi:hypothetical protein
MILYNFFLFLSIRERSYFYYVVFQIANLLALLALSGVAFRYIMARSSRHQQYHYPVLIVLAHVLAIMFTRTFLDTKALLPKQDKVTSNNLGLFTDHPYPHYGARLLSWNYPIGHCPLYCNAEYGIGGIDRLFSL